MTRDTNLLVETMNYINEHPAEHYQGDWGKVVYRNGEPCGTSMCFAGHATVLAGGNFDPEIFKDEYEWYVNEDGKHVPVAEYEDEWGDYELPNGIEHVAKFAREALGLSDEEQGYLFAGHRSVGELNEFVNHISNGYTLHWGRTDSGYYDWSYIKREEKN